ncbi:hypothetical protein D3C81_933850 [compost metagenome]
MAAAEDQRAGAVEGVEQAHGGIGAQLRQHRQTGQQQGERHQQQRAGTMADRQPERLMRAGQRRPQQQGARQRRHGHHRHLHPRSRQRQHRAAGGGHDGDAHRATAQRARHAPHRLRHHCHRDQLEPVQHPGCRGHAVVRDAQREQVHQQCRRQCETQPCGERTGVPRARQPQCNPGLAAGRAGQALAQRDHVGIGGLAQPLAAPHQFVAEERQVRDRTAERRQAEAQEHQEHGKRPVVAVGVFGRAGQGGHVRGERWR